jgi:hypothetical protein
MYNYFVKMHVLNFQKFSVFKELRGEKCLNVSRLLSVIQLCYWLRKDSLLLQ